LAFSNANFHGCKDGQQAFQRHREQWIGYNSLVTCDSNKADANITLIYWNAEISSPYLETQPATWHLLHNFFFTHKSSRSASTNAYNTTRDGLLLPPSFHTIIVTLVFTKAVLDG
jgi:hypothetical protein